MDTTKLALGIEELEPMEAPSDAGDLLLGVLVGVGIGLVIVAAT